MKIGKFRSEGEEGDRIVMGEGTISQAGSSRCLGFSNPVVQPRCWAVTLFCMQFGNRLERTMT